MKTLRIVLFACVLLAFTGCASMQPAPEGPKLLAPIPSYGAAPLIRVKLSAPSRKDAVIVSAGEAWLSVDGRRGEAHGDLSVRHEGGYLTVNGREARHSIEISPMAEPHHFVIDGRMYRGRLRVIRQGASWDVVNVVDLEQYVAGVVGWEMIPGWPVEALKAQAVASRTYAVFEMQAARDQGRQWDVDDTTQYQVYGGVGPADKRNEWRENANVLKARQATNGRILTYQGKGIRAFFHSTSGGHTVDPVVGFGIDATIEPLAGVDLGDFGKDSPRHVWEVEMREHEVRARLIEAGISPFDIIRIEAARTAPSGHAVTLRLFKRNGHHEVVSAITVRRALGLASTHFTAEKLGEIWTFRGRGFGHGCGMCQWSARGMAAAGWDAERILRTMYPGADITAMY